MSKLLNRRFFAANPNRFIRRGAFAAGRTFLIEAEQRKMDRIYRIYMIYMIKNEKWSTRRLVLLQFC